MTRRTTLRALAPVSVLLAVLGVMAFLVFNTAPAAVHGQNSDGETGTTETPTPTPTPDPVVNLDADNVEYPETLTIVGDNGTLTISNEPVLVPGPSPATQNQGTTSDDLVKTALTADDITLPTARLTVAWLPNSPVEAGTTYSLRRTQLVGYPNAPTTTYIYDQFVKTGLTGRTVRDADVQPHGYYKYHVFQHSPGGSVDEVHSVLNDAMYARPRELFSGRGTADGVSLHIRSMPTVDLDDHRVTITRYDHRERHDSEGVAITTLSGLADERSMISDNSATAGTIYYYEIEYFEILTAGADPTPMFFTVPPIAVMAGENIPSTPNEPTVEIDPATGFVTVSWTVDDDNKQAGAYEVSRVPLLPVRPANEYIPLPVGTTVSSPLTLITAPDDIPYTYVVNPHNLGVNRTAVTSPSHMYPPLLPPACNAHYPNAKIAALPFVNLVISEFDILGSPQSNRIIDVWGVHGSRERCDNLDPRRFHLVREVRKNGSRMDRLSGIVYDAKRASWGYPRFMTMSFEDAKLEGQGAYSITYRVCATGFETVGTTGLCSFELGTGYFQSDGSAAESRTYPAGVTAIEH